MSLTFRDIIGIEQYSTGWISRAVSPGRVTGVVTYNGPRNPDTAFGQHYYSAAR